MSGRSDQNFVPIQAEFERWAGLHPSAPALRTDDGIVTYQELNLVANQLARHMQRRGVQQEDVVGAMVGRGELLVALLLACLKVGAIYLPLDEEGPIARRQTIIDEAKPRVIFLREMSTVSDVLTPGYNNPGRMVEVLSGELELNGYDGADLLPAERRLVSPELGAYLLYTSGSTGRPKGVVNIHRGLAHRVESMRRHCPIGPGDRVLVKAPETFDISIWEMLWPLVSGACCVVAKKGGHLDAAYLSSLILDGAVTEAHFVPSMLRTFISGARRDDLRTLRRVFCGGEMLSGALARKFSELSDAKLYNVYGPTECSIDVTLYPWDVNSSLVAIPIGHPVNGATLDVQDARTVEGGGIGAGELVIGGAAVARGYLGQPGLTALKFVPDPQGAPGARMYRTGDLGRRTSAEEFEVVGRMDSQIKRHGVRIEPGEIEAHLEAMPGVSAAAVIVLGDDLIASIVMNAAGLDFVGDSVPITSHMWQRLTEVLPQPMLPSRILVRQELPRLTNGKTDRETLKGLIKAQSLNVNLDAGVSVSTGGQERAEDLTGFFLRHFKLLLCGAEVGPESDFFGCGGNSILAVTLIRAVQEEGIRISLSDVFEDPCPRGLSGRATRLRNSESEASGVIDTFRAGDQGDGESRREGSGSSSLELMMDAGDIDKIERWYDQTDRVSFGGVKKEEEE